MKIVLLDQELTCEILPLKIILFDNSSIDNYYLKIVIYLVLNTFKKCFTSTVVLFF